MIGYCPLASGSKGNCIYLGTPHAKLLIDVGISHRMTKTRLAEIGIDLEEIDAILITHDHTDHIKGLSIVSEKYNIPIFANSDTAKGIYRSLGVCPKFKIFTTGEPFEFADIEVSPFSIQHDTLDPVAFTIRLDGLKLGFCTDLGFVTSSVVHELQGCDYLYVESNHQPSMVHASLRSRFYKERVLGRQGHLSNESCGDLLVEVFHPGLKYAHLAHLSSECNNPDLALDIVGKKLKERGYLLPLSIAHQDRLSEPVVFK